MHSESIEKCLNYKLRELELIIRQINSDKEHTRIDIDLALEKTRQLYDILLGMGAGDRRTDYEKSIPTGKPVIPSDPDPVEDDNIYEAEGIIPSPSHYMEKDHQRQESINEAEDQLKKQEGNGRAADKDPATGQSENTGTDHPASEPVASYLPADIEKERDTDIPEKSDPGTKEQKNEKNASGQKDTAPEITWPENKTQSRPSEIGIVADKYQSSQNYINQALARKQTKKDLTSKLQSRPISDLRYSIGLNDKFLFIKELFKGRPEKYNECIDDLNNSESFEDALNLAKSKYSLDKNDEIVDKLLSLVKRKHQAE
jgi:hypothetical protein